MTSPDAIVEQWQGMIDNNFSKTIKQTFNLPEDDDQYVYHSESFAMPLSQIQAMIDTGKMKYHYRGPDGFITVPSADIDAYISIFSSTIDTAKALKSFAANAKRLSPRSQVADHLTSKRHLSSSADPTATPAFKVPKRKSPLPNPYFDIWAWSCHETGFVGPLPDAHYAHPSAAKQTHPMLPVLYHHFGCACPSWEALSILSQLASSHANNGVLDMASGNGYWTYMLRRLGVRVVAVDNAASSYRYTWIADTVHVNGVEYLRQQKSNAAHLVLLLVYPVTKGGFTRQVIRAYRGDTIVVVGTQNANRFTAFEDCLVEEWFEREMKGWDMTVRIALPSFAGKDEAMYVFQKEGGGK